MERWLKCFLTYCPDAAYSKAFMVQFLDVTDRPILFATNPGRVYADDKVDYPPLTPFHSTGYVRVEVVGTYGFTTVINLGTVANHGSRHASIPSYLLVETLPPLKQTQCILRKL